MKCGFCGVTLPHAGQLGVDPEWQELSSCLRYEAAYDKEQFGERLAKEHLPDLPKNVTDLVFRKAWEDGHADGLHQVEQQYEEIAEIVSAAFEAGDPYNLDVPDRQWPDRHNL